MNSLIDQTYRILCKANRFLGTNDIEPSQELRSFLEECKQHADKLLSYPSEMERLKDEIALKDEILRKYKKENEKLQRVALRKGWE